MNDFISDSITRNGTNFDFYYDSQLEDLTQKQTVNVKAISLSYSLTPRLYLTVV